MTLRIIQWLLSSPIIPPSYSITIPRKMTGQQSLAHMYEVASAGGEVLLHSPVPPSESHRSEAVGVLGTGS